MRPVRINLVAITEKRFVDLMMKYFPYVEDTHVEWLKQFYIEMSDRYFQVILDLDSGEVIQAFLPDGTWALSKFYLDLVPTPDKLDEKGFPLMEGETDLSFSDKLGIPKKKKGFTVEEEIVDEKVIDKILDKIAKRGRESLSAKEEGLLNRYVNKNK